MEQVNGNIWCNPGRWKTWLRPVVPDADINMMHLCKTTSPSSSLVTADRSTKRLAREPLCFKRRATASSNSPSILVKLFRYVQDWPMLLDDRRQVKAHDPEPHPALKEDSVFSLRAKSSIW
ncbi:hypothetical protein FHL15_006865 [Xylaria flabelliformis]|uniref:Uncharacterized protein n=1 Tax=Xylaria flabelliformis TaxID=2512241 RepID=A0A553HWD1_9PEZI|nr:hypothetical protein FHL15_006865 [Xylaria flabelliformis]